MLVAGVIATLPGCGLFERPQRPAWREAADKACAARRTVRMNAYVQPARSIDGPGICGLNQPLKVAALKDGTIAISSAATLNCPMTEALEKWMLDVVQPAAWARFKQPVTQIDTMGSYGCRPINNKGGAKLSEHAFGNAIDIGGFRLADGQKITLVKGWTKGDEQEKGTRQRGADEQTAVTRADEQSYGVRDDKTDECDDSDDCHSRGDGDDSGTEGEGARALDRDAHGPRCAITEGEHIQVTGYECRKDHRKCKEGQGRPHGRPGREREAAGRPEGRGARTRVIGHGHDDGEHGCGERRHRDTTEDKCHHLGAPRCGARDPQNQGHASDARDCRTDRSEPHGSRDGRPDRCRDRDGGNRSECSARGDTDDSGIGERIAQRALEQRTRDTQPSPHDECEGNPWGANLGDDDTRRLGCSHQQSSRGRCDEDDGQRNEHDGGPSPARARVVCRVRAAAGVARQGRLG